ncbi:MAG: abortive infection family protein [Solirubrobacteraceae bacterium]|nr:abortive infection family protein [Solirubrobacteraceae bacterium]
MTDPEGAITAARSLLESVCKTILEDMTVEYDDRDDDLPKLYKRVSKALTLAPSDHTEEQFKAILGGCTTVVNGLGSIRNRASDAHGHGRKSYRPGSRHAALAVNLAGATALFLMETYEARQSE